mgnify:CR=1 FL=1
MRGTVGWVVMVVILRILAEGEGEVFDSSEDLGARIAALASQFALVRTSPVEQMTSVFELKYVQNLRALTNLLNNQHLLNLNLQYH